LIAGPNPKDHVLEIREQANSHIPYSVIELHLMEPLHLFSIANGRGQLNRYWEYSFSLLTGY